MIGQGTSKEPSSLHNRHHWEGDVDSVDWMSGSVSFVLHIRQ